MAAAYKIAVKGRQKYGVVTHSCNQHALIKRTVYVTATEIRDFCPKIPKSRNQGLIFRENSGICIFSKFQNIAIPGFEFSEYL